MPCVRAGAGMASLAARCVEPRDSLRTAARYVAGLPAQARRTRSTHAHIPPCMVAVGHGGSCGGVCAGVGCCVVEQSASGLRGGSTCEAVRYAERCLERTTGRDEGARKSRGFSPSRARARDGLACRKVGGQDAGDTDETPSSFASAKRRATAGTGGSGSFVACAAACCQPGVCRGAQRAGRAGR